MISHFININRRALAIIIVVLMANFFSCEVFSSQQNMFYLPNNAGCIFWQCDNGLCNTYLKIKDKKTVIVEKGSFPSVDKLTENLVRLYFSCGSPCNYTLFYDLQYGVSRAFEFAVAVDSKREIVIVAEKDQLIGYEIFDKTKKPVFTIKRNWSPTVALFTDILEAKFANNVLYIKYLDGARFNEKEEMIRVC